MIRVIAKCSICDWQLSCEGTAKEFQQILISGQVHTNRTHHKINIIGAISEDKH